MVFLRKKTAKNVKTKGQHSFPECWYYDACALDRSKSSYGEMFNKNHPIKAVVSHLSFGEAYANAHLKGEKQADAFIRLMRSLSQYVTIVGNDGCESEFKKIRSFFPRLSITDSVHLATAILNRCVVIRTIDSDFIGLPRRKLNELGSEFGLPHLSIKKMF